MKDRRQDEITLKEIFLKIGEYFIYVRSKWKWMLFTGLILGVLMAFRSSLEVPMYRETLTFMMDEKEGGGIPGLELLGGLLGGSKQNDNLGKILQLFESKRIIHNTLFDTVELRGQKEVLANHYLEQYGVDELLKSYQYPLQMAYKTDWPKIMLQDKNFRFFHDDVDNFSPKENQYLRVIYEKIAGNSSVGLPAQLNSSMDEETGMMSLRMMSEYEHLTLSVLNNTYKQLSQFFITKTIEKQQKTYDIMRAKRDSVITTLKSAEYELAVFKDRNRNIVTVQGNLKNLRLEREVTILNLMYAEVVKQMEATDFALKNKMPVVQVIDLPRRPIVATRSSWKKSLFLGLITGIFMGVVFFASKRFFADIMS